MISAEASTGAVSAAESWGIPMSACWCLGSSRCRNEFPLGCPDPFRVGILRALSELASGRVGDSRGGAASDQLPIDALTTISDWGEGAPTGRERVTVLDWKGVKLSPITACFGLIPSSRAGGNSAPPGLWPPSPNEVWRGRELRIVRLVPTLAMASAPHSHPEESSSPVSLEPALPRRTLSPATNLLILPSPSLSRGGWPKAGRGRTLPRLCSVPHASTAAPEGLGASRSPSPAEATA